MELGIDTPEDWNIKYRDTVALQNDEVVFLQKMRSDGLVEMYTLRNGAWTPDRAHIAELELDHTVPECGIINFKKTCINVFRTGHKQYRRGFTFHNEAFAYKALLENSHKRVFSKSIRQDAKMIDRIFHPIYYTPEGALKELLNKKRLVAAITNRYYFSVSAHVPYIYLGYDDYIIGRVNETNAKCRLFKSAAPLAQDVSQYISLT